MAYNIYLENRAKFEIPSDSNGFVDKARNVSEICASNAQTQ